MQGLTLDEVATRLNGVVTKQAISKYERGLMSPSPLVLAALQKLYGISSTELSLPVHIITNWNFRRGRLLSAKTEAAIQSEIICALEHHLSDEVSLALELPFKRPFPKNYPVTLDNMEKAALTIRQKWNLGMDSIPFVCRMLERVGIKVLELDIDEDIDGLSGWANEKIPFIALKKNVKVERKRFTALHELAHLLFPALENCPGKAKERLCHRFASALLFPREAFHRHIGIRRSTFVLEELIALKLVYGMSIAALVHRARDLEVITEDYYNHLFNDVINHNRMEEGWGDYPLVDAPGRKMEFLYRQVAEEGKEEWEKMNLKLL